MKRLLASLIGIAGLGVAQAGALQTSLEDILLLTERGVSDETVLVFLETRELGFTPVAEDIDKLLAAGVSEEVIRYILRQTATYSAPPYTYRTATYVDRYPPYYYTPYYAGTSVFFGYSGFPHYWFRHHYGGVHHTPLHHRTVHRPGHNDQGALSHTVHRGLGHNNATGIGHSGARSAGHSVSLGAGSPGHVGAKSGTHRSQHTAARGDQHSVRHSSRSAAHRGGHSGGHSGGHGGGGH